jgi:hypothetical protein
MIAYDELSWDSLSAFKTYLHRRLSNPISRLAESLSGLKENSSNEALLSQATAARRYAEAVQNTLSAWGAFMSYKTQKGSEAPVLRALSVSSFPFWLQVELSQQVALRFDFQKRIEVHTETFFEALLMSLQVMRSLRRVEQLLMFDAPEPHQLVILRCVLAKAEGLPAFTSFSDLLQQLRQQRMGEYDLSFLLLVARDMFAMSGGRFTLQTNTLTEQQALTVSFTARPALPEEAAQSLQLAKRATASLSTVPILISEPPLDAQATEPFYTPSVLAGD